MYSNEFHSLIRRTEPYPHAIVEQGLLATGRRPTSQFRAGSDCALVTWTPWAGGIADRLGTAHQAAGKEWLVMENGYLPSSNGTPRYAVGRGGFNGRGDHAAQNSGRLKSLGLAMQPWRTRGSHILVVGQMGHRDTDTSMPIGWLEMTAMALRVNTSRPLVVRPKAGPVFGKTVTSRTTVSGAPLAHLLENCWAVVTWSSKAAVLALLYGVPVFVMGPYCIAKPLAESNFSDIEAPKMVDDATRLDFLETVADSQWSVEEVAAGDPFRRLLR